MSRLIDADALIDFLDVGHLRHPSELCFSEVDVANLLLHAPTISPDDLRGVVHCRECDLWNRWDSAGRESLGNLTCSCAHWTVEDGAVIHTKPTDFCSYGERMVSEDA